MKSVAALLLALALPPLCLAQAAKNQQLPADVTVVGATWRHAVNWRGSTPVDLLTGDGQRRVTADDPQRQLERRRSNDRLGPIDSESKFHLQTDRNRALVEIRNGGTKTIKAISYDFLFVQAGSGEELLRYQFRNRATIAPGETMTLTNLVTDRRAERFRPIGGIGSEVSAAGEVGYRVVLNRIEYTDGSVWQRR